MARVFIFQTDAFCFFLPLPSSSLSPSLSFFFSVSLSVFLRQRRRNTGGQQGGLCGLQTQVASGLLFTHFLGPCRRHFSAPSAGPGPGPGPGPRRGGLGWEVRQTRPPSLCSALMSAPEQPAPGWPLPWDVCPPGGRLLIPCAAGGDCPRYVCFLCCVVFFFFNL